jgi:hypothetical protein
MKKYSSIRYFNFHDFLRSHSQLLIRSDKNDVNHNNIDLIFMAVDEILLPHHFSKGISIEIIEDDGIKKKFLITSFEDGKTYYVIASYLAIYENSLNYNESSLGFDGLGREKRIDILT